MYSDLEKLVNNDMMSLGYDFTNQDHIKKYWEAILNGN
jgi:hypothetical protein